MDLLCCVMRSFPHESGQALHTKRAEIRVRFRHVPGNLFKQNFRIDLDKAISELVLHVQPDEAIYLKINNKISGLGMRLDRGDLNPIYHAAKHNVTWGDLSADDS